MVLNSLAFLVVLTVLVDLLVLKVLGFLVVLVVLVVLVILEVPGVLGILVVLIVLKVLGDLVELGPLVLANPVETEALPSQDSRGISGHFALGEGKFQEYTITLRKR